MNKIRINVNGQQFAFYPFEDGHVRIELVQGTTVKHIVVNVTLEELSLGWYLWIVKEVPIHEAFPRLRPGELEFLKSGITPDEWFKMFGEELAG